MADFDSDHRFSLVGITKNLNWHIQFPTQQKTNVITRITVNQTAVVKNNFFLRAFYSHGDNSIIIYYVEQQILLLFI